MEFIQIPYGVILVSILSLLKKFVNMVVSESSKSVKTFLALTSILIRDTFLVSSRVSKDIFLRKFIIV